MAHRAEKKRKALAEPSSAPSQKYHLVKHATYQAPQKAPNQGRWVFRPPQQQGASHPPAPQQNGPRPNAPPSLRPSSTNRCFNCGDPNHFARKCPQGQYSGQNKENKDEG